MNIQISRRQKRLSRLAVVMLAALLCLSACAKDAPDDNPTAETPVSEGAQEGSVVAATPAAQVFDSVIQVGSTNLSLPVTVGDFLACGAVFEDGEINGDRPMEAGSIGRVKMEIDDTGFYLSIANNTDSTCALKDTEAYVSSSQGPGIVYRQGLKVGDSLADMRGKWGEPSLDRSESSETELLFDYLEYPVLNTRVLQGVGSQPASISATGHKYTVVIDKSSSLITDIQWKWVDNSPGTRTAALSESMEYAGETVTLTYQVPWALYQNSIGFGKRYMSVYGVGGEPYVVVLDTYLAVRESPGVIVDRVILSDFGADLEEVEIVSNDSQEGRALGYNYGENYVECKILFLNEQRSYTSAMSASKIIPLDEDGVLSEDAIAAFKGIMEDFVNSMQEIQ